MEQRPSDETLGDQYRGALEEWRASKDAELWESTVGDSIEDEPPRPESPANANESGGASRRR
jgi:hypothetical protein